MDNIVKYVYKYKTYDRNQKDWVDAEWFIFRINEENDNVIEWFRECTVAHEVYRETESGLELIWMKENE